VLAWQDYFSKHNVKYFIDSISTVEILNVFYLPELRAAVLDMLPLPPFWNLLIEPAYLFVKNMPDAVKHQVQLKLESIPDMQDIISVMQQPGDPAEWHKFQLITQTLDHIRGESFAATFPEFHSIIQNSI
jgi:hypothetical protein